MGALLCALLTGAAGAAAIKLLDDVILWTLNRKSKKADDATEDKKSRDEDAEKIKAGLKIILLDRIQHLCKTYIKNGEIDVDDLRRLHIMHEIYHNLGGNGDLDILMEACEELPKI